MSITFKSAMRRTALLCLVVSTSLATVFVSRAAAGTEKEIAKTTTKHAGSTMSAKSIESTSLESKAAATPITITHEGHSFLAFPPAKDASAKPMTILYLHGVNGRAENGCPHFRSGASELGWLVCPEGVEKSANGMAASWGGDVFKQSIVVTRAIKAAEANGASSEPGVAVGFSQGSYVALDLVKTNLGHFRGLVLIAAPEAHPSAQKLHDAGIKRVVLAAGALDGSHDALAEDTKRLQREGMDARFYDLGKIGHTYAAEDTSILRDAITWAAGAN